MLKQGAQRNDLLHSGVAAPNAIAQFEWLLLEEGFTQQELSHVY